MNDDVLEVGILVQRLVECREMFTNRAVQELITMAHVEGHEGRMHELSIQMLVVDFVAHDLCLSEPYWRLISTKERVLRESIGEET